MIEYHINIFVIAHLPTLWAPRPLFTKGEVYISRMQSTYSMEKLTPMMKQYFSIKRQYKDMILFFRMGDFYETFGDDAKIVSKELNIVLTSRNKGKNAIPLAGIPHHALDAYLGKLLKKGYKVAICEQVEDPKKAKGLVRREVVRVVTPGTVLEDSILSTGENNYLMAIFPERRGYGLAFIDISTGEFFATEVGNDEDVLGEINRNMPKEVVVPNDFNAGFLEEVEKNAAITRVEDWIFDEDRCLEALKEAFSVSSVDGLGLRDMPLALRASGAVLNYLIETQKTLPAAITKISPYRLGNYMVIDSSAIKGLELVKNIIDGTDRFTLIWVIDRTITPMGSRLMKKWMLKPLVDVEEINRRLDAVEYLVNNPFLRAEIREKLRSIRDIERVMARVVFRSANARDLIALKNSLKVAPDIASCIRGCGVFLLEDCAENLAVPSEVIDDIESAIVEEPPNTIKEGGIIKDGYNEYLDSLKAKVRESKEWIARLEERERRRTGIKSLKVEYNKVFGYYIEVTKANLHRVPKDYIRKQTLKNAERFITPELKEKESIILSSEEKINALEYEIFCELRDKIASKNDEILRTARAIAILDVLCSLAEVAVTNNYTRPVVDDGDEIVIKDGRHPVLEVIEQNFIPNDATLDCKENRIIIITGPNMAGKSTYMRQIALIVILAQMGSFVPASYARIGIVDKIFTRIGAHDVLSRGQSTFMVEMVELANILRNATKRSLIILDEVGRGTSTFDGLSIAWAVVEYLHDPRVIGAKTLFATHYHQITEISKHLSGVKNYHVDVREDGKDITFLYKVKPGSTDKSYGIHVARLAGVPTNVVERAAEILRKMEEEHRVEVKSVPRSTQTTLGLFVAKKSEIEEKIKSIDIMKMTPIEALNTLYELKKRLEHGKD